MLCLQKLYVVLSHRQAGKSQVSYLHTGRLLAPPFLEVPLELDLCPLQQQLQVLNLCPQRFETANGALVTEGHIMSTKFIFCPHYTAPAVSNQSKVGLGRIYGNIWYSNT